jgi:CRISPR-associated endonuclease Csn1
LFDNNQYEIEHVIPRAKMKNDSFNNLVISEWGVNKAKDKRLAANFIIECNGKCKYGNTQYILFTYEEYEAYCKNVFKSQKGKLKNLLATEVPEDFVERQLNDTRYIGKKLAELLTPIAKNKSGIIFTGGSITFELKNNWGLNKVWKKIILSRFERLEEITGNKYIIHDKDEFGNPVIHFNVKENPELDTKRIDHRHHALDALIIAATTREHIRYLNTLNAADTDDEIKKIRRFLVKHKIRDFKLPWDKFTEQAKNKLEELVVSFKTNNKIISQPKNKTAYFKIEDGKIKKDLKEQKANPKWMSVRKSMFKEPRGIVYLKEIYDEKNINKAIEIQIDRMLVQNTPDMKIASYVYDQDARKIIKGLIERIGIPIREKDTLLKEIKNQLKKNPLKDLSGKKYKTIKVAKFEEYASKRVTLDKSFDHKKIDTIPYAKIGKSVLGKLLHEHLNSKEFKNDKGKQDSSKAFSNEGLEILAKKTGRPITKLTICEKKDESSKFGKQYLETDAGSNIYFVIYENQKTYEREGFKSIPTHKAIEKIIKGELVAEDRMDFNKIILSPGDLVYVPTIEQIKHKSKIDWNNKKDISERIYQVRKFSKKQCYFLKSRISDMIIPYDSESKIGEYGSQNLSERSDDDLKIIDCCIKLKVDRLGNIKPDIYNA